MERIILYRIKLIELKEKFNSIIMLPKKCQPLGCQKITHKNIGIEAL